jgi:hypothetical protein
MDIDNTSSDYTGSLVQFAARYFGWEVLPEAHQYDGTMRIGDWLGLSDHDYRQMKLAYRQGGGKRMQPVLPGIKLLLLDLAVAGAEIWMTTTRPYNRFDSTDPDTRWWLNHHDLEHEHLLYDDDKYGVLKSIVGDRLVAVVDDEVANYDRAMEVHGNPILAKFYPYNSGFTRDYEALSLTDLRLELLSRIEAYNER